MRSRACLASSLVLGLWSLIGWGATNEGLLAPVYPGAVHAPEYDNGRYQVWLSQDPPEKVSAWYRERLGMEPGQAIGKHDWFPLLEQQQVDRMLRSAQRDWTLAEDAGVDVRHHPLAPAKADEMRVQGQARSCRSDHFMMLWQLVGRNEETQADFDALCRKYGWIEHAYYRLHGPKGQRQLMDEYLLEQDRNRLLSGNRKSAVDARALSRRMQELVQQGRFEEAGSLMQDFQAASQAAATLPADAWDQWVEHLEKVARHAYRTMIRIHLHPSRWTDRPADGME